MSWLDPVRRALDGLDSSRPVFVRDDDAGWADERLFALMEVCAELACPLDVAVIPAELSAGLARRLLNHQSSAPVRFHQHGLTHVSHQRSGRKGEFGSDRSVAEMTGDIVAGSRILGELIGQVDPIFTPPWNRCAPALFGVLAELDFSILSRDHTAPRADHPGLREIPVTVDWFGHHRGVRWTPARLAERLAASLRADNVTGLMLHHEVTDPGELRLVAEALDLLTWHPQARMGTLNDWATLPASV
jgi:peptidoglycan/xylan/chitin deacetylase (PgdA/CDA1 family)